MLTNLMDDIASDTVLEQAYRWLCQRRKDYSHNDAVWEVRYRWSEIKPQLQRALREGCYTFCSLRRIHGTDDDLVIWSALDSLVLKAIRILLAKRLAPKLSKRCTHLAGNGGAKAAVREVLNKLAANKALRGSKLPD